MQINRAGLDLIKQYEGLRLIAYQDIVGVWTVGYGHTGADVKPGEVITQAQAEQLLSSDLRNFESGVTGMVTAPVSANEFAALVSFSYNLGLGDLRSSTLLRLLNQGNDGAAAGQFPRWNQAGGQIVPGLTKRRLAEQALFQTPSSAERSQPGHGGVHLNSFADRFGKTVCLLTFQGEHAMQDELQSLHDTASKLLSSHLGHWAESLVNATAGHDDNRFLSVLHALLSIRSAVAPLLSQLQDPSHG